jgi:hypothetical protein
MKYWLLMVVMFAFFAVACEDKTAPIVDERDAGAKVEEKHEAEKAAAAAKEPAEAPKGKAEVPKDEAAADHKGKAKAEAPKEKSKAKEKPKKK